MDLQRLAEQLREINRKYDDINSGGCGKFALALGEKLKKEGYAYRYVLLSDMSARKAKDRVKQFNSDIKNGNFKDLQDKKVSYVVAHIMVYCNGRLMDSTGVYKSIPLQWDWYKMAGFIPDEVLCRWCDRGGWNYKFDTALLTDIKEDIDNLILN